LHRIGIDYLGANLFSKGYRKIALAGGGSATNNYRLHG
jgi:hypothetical protein